METTMQLDCLLDYPYFNENSKLIAIDLSRKEALDTDPRAIQQVNFTENLIEQNVLRLFSFLRK